MTQLLLVLVPTYLVPTFLGMPIRATLTVARKMVAYRLAVDRGKRDFVPAEDHKAAAA
jgi:hypothetical protein